MWIFPTDYTDKATLVDWDKVFSYDSEAVENVNFTLLSIFNYITNKITTSDVDEGTNLYYTDARVTANSTVTALWADKADKSNVLELDNTTAFTPSADYEPATKKYVDDSGTNIDGLTEDSSVTSWDKFIYHKSGVGNRSVDYDDILWNSYSIVAWETILTSLTNEDTVGWGNWVTPVYVKVKEIKLDKWGTYTVDFNLKRWGDANTATWRIYVNWVAVWTERTVTSDTYKTVSAENITVSDWDLLQLYLKPDSDINYKRQY